MEVNLEPRDDFEKYLKTTRVLNAVLLGLLLLDFVTVISAGSASGTQTAFIVACTLGAMATTTLMIVYKYTMSEGKLHKLATIECLYLIVWVIFFLVVASCALANGGSCYVAAGIFGLFTTTWYIVKIVYIVRYVDYAEKQSATKGLLLLDFICILAGGSGSSTQVFYLIATIVGAIVTNLLVIVSLFSLYESIKLPWAFIEFIYVIVWAIFFLVVSGLALARGGSYIAAGVFGLFTAIWYILKIIYLYITEVANPPAAPYPTTE